MTHVQNTTGAAITVESGAGASALRVEGDLDFFTAPQLRDGFANVVGLGDVLIDISGVPFMDPAGLGALIGGESGGCGRQGRWRRCAVTVERFPPAPDDGAGPHRDDLGLLWGGHAGAREGTPRALQA